MNATPGRRPVAPILEQRDARGVLLAASRDPDAKITYVALGGRHQTGLVLKIPATNGAAAAVEREGRMLVDLRRNGLGRLADTVPRYVASLDLGGRPVLVSTALPGLPMSQRYHGWRHTSRPAAVARDLEVAGRWLEHLQTVTARAEAPVTWAATTASALRGRWDGDPLLPAALERLESAGENLAVCRTPLTAVHGDFWFGNLLLTGRRVSGVVDWEYGEPQGCPLRDLARFALSYSLYLDRHTRQGHSVRGHPGLSRTGVAPGVRYALDGNSWLHRLERDFLVRGLVRLGVPAARWYDVALTGVAEVAASANDDDFGHDHLQLLAELPAYPRRQRRQS